MAVKFRVNTKVTTICLLMLAELYSKPVHAQANTYILAVSAAESYRQGLPKLEYADQDAKRFVSVMESVGGVPPEHVFYLPDSSHAQLLQAEKKIERLLAADPGRRAASRKFVFYFSGHSDEYGLHLSDEVLPKNEYLDFIEHLEVDTKIVLLDSCYSGGLVSKGAVAKEAVVLPPLEIDEPKGTIFITSSSGNEMAYESSKFEGSIFTHYLVRGLLGEADTNGDGLVTVDELYQFLYQRMRADPNARQHPEATQSLHGRGALVLSMPKETKTRQITLTAELNGEVKIASAGGLALFTAVKDKGQAESYKLPPGIYDITITNPKQGTGYARVDLTGNHAILDTRDLTWSAEPRLLASKGASSRYYWFDLAVGYDQPNGDSYVGGPYASVGGRIRLIEGSLIDWELGASVFYHHNKVNNGVATADTDTEGVVVGPVAVINTRIGSFPIAAVIGGALVEAKWHYAQGTGDAESANGPSYGFSVGYRYEMVSASVAYELNDVGFVSHDSYLSSVVYTLGLQL